ncbi:ABC transporter ATP-binding protein [Bremerella cremea]|uniref:ABC transporter ATP-binding protein n=1 Tax=Bremerella cremea TaxID=1031537 RepID=A0A368KRV7_9BACT|nr:ABC transporter ATP-binding protein [Bremerella cremea]RCS50579.1 ABC transporter ATP-binding protein [Bremerella cremea]
MLHLENVKKSFRLPTGNRMPILDVPKFDVAAAEQMVIVGRSGCGKSTLLHLIAGIGTPDSGVIAINGLDITRLSEDGRDRFRAEVMGYVFQTFNLLQGFTALENVILGMSFSRGRVDRSRAHDLLQRVGLGHRLNSYPRTMSVGEQQRVAVARALANRPKLLLADEPTANVDPANQQSIVDLIRQTCQEEEIALVMVTHAMEVAEQFQRVEPLEKLNLLAQAKKAHA